MTVTRYAVCSTDSDTILHADDMVWFGGYHICRDCLDHAYLTEQGLAIVLSRSGGGFDSPTFDFDTQRWLAYNWAELTTKPLRERPYADEAGEYESWIGDGASNEYATIEYYRSA